MELYVPVTIAGFLIAGSFSILIVKKAETLIHERTTIKAWRIKAFAVSQCILIITLLMILLHPTPGMGLYAVDLLLIILVASLAILALQSFLYMFSVEERDVGEISWSLVGKKTGLCKFYCIMTRKLVSLTAPVIGLEMIRSLHSEVASSYPVLKTLSIDENGKVYWRFDNRRAGVSEIVGSFSIFLNSIYRAYRSVLARDADQKLKRALQPVIGPGHLVLDAKPRVISSLFGGLLCDKSSTGTAVDDIVEGGLEHGSSTLLIAPPDTERETFERSFLLQGLISGERCIYVSSLKSPDSIEEIYRELAGKASEQLRIVDCHSSLMGEKEEYAVVPDGNRIHCPNFVLLDYAIARAMSDSPFPLGRAVIDVLPSWANTAKHDNMAPIVKSVASMIEGFRDKGYSCVFVVDPECLDQRKQSLLSELVDNKIQLTKKMSQLEILMPKGAPRERRRSVIPAEDWNRGSIGNLASSSDFLSTISVLQSRIPSGTGEAGRTYSCVA